MYPVSVLDTDILSELLKGNKNVQRRAAEYLKAHKRLTISHIQKYEILKGLKAKKAERQIIIFNQFAASNHVLPISDDVIETASDIYAFLRSEGNLISDADILVGAIAISYNLVLVTNNTKHFSRIKNLTLANWKD